jgi:CHAT domain-containing protein/Tfp pilus assembly protein PilF
MAAPLEDLADVYTSPRRLIARRGRILSTTLLAALCLSLSSDATLSQRTPAQLLGAFRVTPGRLPGLDYASFPTPPRIGEGALRRALARARRNGRSAVLIDLAFGATVRAALAPRGAAASSQDSRRACELSALFLGLAAEGDEPLRHASRALTWAEAALRHDPALAEAHFNRALALERLSLTKDAAAAWEQYLEIDSESPWAEEARHRRRQLIETTSYEQKWQRARRELEKASPARASEIVRELAQPSRLWVERTLLTGWARSQRNREQPEIAAQWIDRAFVVSMALARETGDFLTLEAVQIIQRAQESEDTSRLARLAEGHSTLVAAIEQHERGIGCREEGAFERSESRLREAGSPMALWATFYRSNCSFRQREYGQARKRLREALAHCRSDRYRTVCGRALWLKGLMDFHESRPGEAFAAYSEARRLLAKERPFLAVVLLLQTEVHLLLGERARAWESLDASLQHLEALPVSENPRRQGIFQGAALLAAAEGDVPAALRFEAAALEVSQASPGGVDDALILRERANIHHRAGDIPAASADLQQAEARLYGVEERSGKTVQAEVQVLRAQLFPHTQSAEDWAARVQVLEETSNRIVLPQALLFLGRAHAREQDLRAAERAWLRGLEELDRFQPFLAGRQKSDYFERRDSLLAELLPVQIQLDPLGARAFHAVERARRRSSLSRPSKAADVTCEQLRKALPPGHVLLEYAVLPDRLLIWVIGRERTVFRSLPLSLPQLSSRLHRLQRAGERELAKLLGELYSMLFAPVRDAIPAGSTLLIVPDWRLYAVPFAALRDPTRDRFLVDDYVLTSLPDARSILQHGLREQPSRPLRSLLALGDPAFPREQHPALRRLDGAGEEAKAIWSLYDPALSRLRLQEQATPSEFFQGLGRYDVVHYGGHGAAMSPDPALARLIFAPEAGRSSDLAALELYGRDFSGTRLVVLAACETAAARAWAPRVGLEGFVEPLLEGGVRNVLASLWKIEDDASRQQVLAFHRELRRTGDPLRALANIQRRGRQQGQPIRRWAALALFGVAL